MNCIVCDKSIKTGLWGDDKAKFCNTVCACWFARAVENVVFLPGEDYRKINTFLASFVGIEERRARVAARGGR